MKNNLTPKQEKFAQKYIELSNASQAYRKVYDAKNMKTETINRNAKALLDNNKVAARINQLRERHLKKHEITMQTIAAELEEARQLAMRIEQPSPMVSASMGKAKLYGLITDKSEQNNTGEITINLNKIVHSARNND